MNNQFIGSIILVVSLLGGFLFSLLVLYQVIEFIVNSFGWKKVELSHAEKRSLINLIYNNDQFEKKLFELLHIRKISWKKSSFDRITAELKIK